MKKKRSFALCLYFAVILICVAILLGLLYLKTGYITF